MRVLEPVVLILARFGQDSAHWRIAPVEQRGGGGLAAAVLDLTALRAELAKVNGVGEVGSGSFTDTWQ